MSVKKEKKTILFYNAIPMPHSIKTQKLFTESGYEVKFWYYKDLTTLYPWNTLDSNYRYFIYGEKGNNLLKLLKQAWVSDIVIISGWHNKIHIILSFFCFFFKIKYAYWIDVPDQPKKSFKTFFKKVLLNMVNYIFITGKEGIVRLSKWYNLNKKKMYDFPYLSTDIEEILVENNNNIRILKLNEGDKIKVLICNRFEERKGYHSFYEALKILDKKTLQSFSFIIVGSGTQYEKYKRLFADLNLNLEIKFWVEYEHYRQLIRETDVLLHPSLHEPFGIPPIDAMAHGKLVIASDCVMSVYDRIVSGSNGFIYDAGNSVQLANLFKNLAENQKIIYELGLKAIKTSKLYTYDYNLQVISKLL